MNSRLITYLTGFLSVIFASCTFHHEFAVNRTQRAYSNFRRYESREINPTTLQSWINSSNGSANYHIFPFVVTEAIKRESNDKARKALVDYYIELYLQVKRSTNLKVNHTVISSDWKLFPVGGKISLKDASIGTFECVPLGQLHKAIQIKESQSKIIRLKELVEQLQSHGSNPKISTTKELREMGVIK